MPDNTPPSQRVEFTANHRPGLLSGDYTLSVQPSLSIKGDVKGDLPNSVTQAFSVAGERFSINPTEIKSVFPPESSLGDHSNVFPHLILGRSTLPWERTADYAAAKDVAPPWLALLVFDDDANELPAIKLLTIKQLQSPDPAALQADQSAPQGVAGTFPNIVAQTSATPASTSVLKMETGQHLDDVVRIIDVKASVLKAQLPSYDGLQYLTHVRQGIDDDANTEGEELAIIVANRLPKRGGRTVVHLVSLEGRYNPTGFDLLGANGNDLVRLISLKSWSFSCLEAYKISPHTIDVLKQTTTIAPNLLDQLINIGEVTGTPEFLQAVAGVIGQGDTNSNREKILDSATHETFRGLLRHLDSGTLHQPIPANLPGLGQQYLKLGATALPHLMRNGNQSVSWYRGPLVTAPIQQQFHGRALLDAFSVLDANNLLQKLKQPDDNFSTNLASQLSLPTRNALSQWDNSSTDAILSTVLKDLNYLIKNQNLYAPEFFSTALPANLQAMLDQQLQGDNLSKFNRLLLHWAYPSLIADTNFQFPIHTADEVVMYDPNLGMFDVSYASAWELGRLLALKDKKFSLELFNWKRAQSQTSKYEVAEAFEHLPFQRVVSNDPVPVPQTVVEWLNELRLLKRLPFNYLVPEEDALPTESIRFFRLDNFWVDCLTDGAFSIGRMSTKDGTRDRLYGNEARTNPYGEISGFLLRSDVVKGWPDLLVEGYSKLIADDNPTTQTPLKMLRMERMSPNILLCLFQGLVQTVDIHQKPEALHFGLDPLTKGYEKKLRTAEGDELVDSNNNPVSLQVINKPGANGVTFWRDADNRNLDISVFVTELKKLLQSNNQSVTPFTSAELALQLIEGVEKVRFRIDL